MRHPAPREVDSSINEFWIENPFEFEQPDTPVNLSMFERNRLFINQGGGFLVDASHFSGVDVDSDSRAVAIGDLNNDGSPDIVLRNVGGGPLRIFLNQFRAHRSLQITLRGTQSNSGGIGARLVLEVGDRRLYREHSPQNSMMAQCANETIFGLGDYDGPLKLTITWPSGVVQKIENLKPGRMQITEPKKSES